MATFNTLQYPIKANASVRIRSAVDGDAEALVELTRSVLSEGRFMAMALEEFVRTEADQRAWIHEHAADPGRVALVAEWSGQIVGLLYFESGDLRRFRHQGTLHMFVSAACRGQGVGRALLSALIAWAESHPVLEKLNLSVWDTNAPAISLYRSMGFVEQGRLPRQICVAPGEYIAQVMMYRFVGEPGIDDNDAS